MTTLIIPDIHLQTDWIESFLSKTPHDLVVFLGDYLDSHRENNNGVFETIKACLWLKKSIKKPNRIHLLGNHDLSYMFSHNPLMFCPGFTKEKSLAVNDHFPKELWRKFKLYHKIDNFIFSHAGIKNERLLNSDNPLTEGLLDHFCKDSLTQASYMKSPFLADMESLVWLRWWDFPITNGFNQIVGHTFHEIPQVNIQPELIDKKEQNFNVDLDTDCKYYGILHRNGHFGYNIVGDDVRNTIWVN